MSSLGCAAFELHGTLLAIHTLRPCLALTAPLLICWAIGCGAPERDHYSVHPSAVALTPSGALATGPVVELGEVVAEVSMSGGRIPPGDAVNSNSPAPNQLGFRVAASASRRVELNWVANVAPFAGIPATDLERAFPSIVEMRDRPGALFDVHWGARMRLLDHRRLDVGFLLLAGLETSWAAKEVREDIYSQGYRPRGSFQAGLFAGGHVAGPLSLTATVAVETMTEANDPQVVVAYSASEAARRVPAIRQSAAYTTGLDAELRFGDVALTGSVHSAFGHGSRAWLPTVAGRAGLRYYFGTPRSARLPELPAEAASDGGDDP